MPETCCEMCATHYHRPPSRWFGLSMAHIRPWRDSQRAPQVQRLHKEGSPLLPKHYHTAIQRKDWDKHGEQLVRCP